MQDIPLVTAHGALTYFFPINADWEASVRGAYDWTDSLPEPVNLIPTGQIPSHGFASLRATVSNSRWMLAVFANNLTNKHAELEATPALSLNFPPFYRITTNQPLTVGVDFNVKF